MVTHVGPTDSSCRRMIPSFVGTGRVKEWLIAGHTNVDVLTLGITAINKINSLA